MNFIESDNVFIVSSFDMSGCFSLCCFSLFHFSKWVLCVVLSVGFNWSIYEVEKIV